MKRARRPKTFMGVPFPKSGWASGGQAYRWRIVNIIGATPTKPASVPRKFVKTEGEFDDKRRFNIGRWDNIESAKDEALKINRRAIRYGSARWAILEFMPGQESLEGQCRAIADQASKLLPGTKVNLSVYAFRGYDDEGEPPFRAYLQMNVSLGLESPKLSKAQVATALEAALNQVKSALVTVKPPKRTSRKRGLKLIA